MKFSSHVAALLSFLLVTPALAAFSDVPTHHPYATAILDLQARGIVDGYGDGTYRADATINRAEFTKIVIGAIDLHGDAASCDRSVLSYYSDVPSSAWYAPAVCFAYVRGIARGHLNTNAKPTFVPGEPINAIEGAKIISVAFGIGDPPMDCAADYGAECYREAQNGNPWYRRHVEAMAERGALPRSITSFQHSLTRGEMAEMIYRILAKRTDLSSLTYQELLQRTNPSGPQAQRPVGLEAMLSGAGDVAIPYVDGQLNQERHVRLLFRDGVRRLTSYQEKLQNQSIARTYLLSPDGLFYLAGVGANGFTVLDRNGEDRTDDFGFLEDKNFPIHSYYRIDADRYAFGVHSTDGSESQPAGLFVASRSGKARKSLSLSEVGLEGLSGLVPICLSADGQSIYARYQGWEGFSYGAVWKVRLSDMKATAVITDAHKIYRYNCHDRSDRIVGVRTERNENAGMGGSPSSPSSIVLFDGAKGTSVTLKSSQDKLFTSAAITPDGKRVVYVMLTASTRRLEEYDDPFWGEGVVSELRIMDLDGTHDQSLGAGDEIEGMSFDGSLVLARRRSITGGTPDTYALVSIDGRVAPFTAEGGALEVLSCGYGQGFDCLY